MRSAPTLLLAALLGAGCAARAVTEPGDLAPPERWPTRGWEQAAPEEVGLDPVALARVVRAAREHTAPGRSFHSLTLVRDGRVALEACFEPYDCARLHDIASVTKSLVATLVGIAVDRGQLSLDQPILELFPEVDADGVDPRKRRVTVEDLVGMTSGLACGLEPGERELYAMVAGDDWIAAALALPMESEPGTRFAYCSPGYHLLAAALGRATGERVDRFAREALFDPLGIGEVVWPLDPQGVPHGWGDVRMHPRDMAKLGLLYLHGGLWEGRQVVSRDLVRRAVRRRVDAGGGDGYGLGWWLPGAALPGLFEARGRAGQEIVVWPARDVVLAVTAGGARLDAIVPDLLGAFRAEGAGLADPAADAALEAAVTEARPAPAVPPVSPAARELATRLSGRRYRFDREHPAQVSGFRVTAPRASDELWIEIERRGRMFPLRVGLDGRYRTVREGPGGVPMAARVLPPPEAHPGALAIELTEPAGVNHLTLTLRPLDGLDELAVEIGDVTGHMGGALSARPARSAP